MYSTRCSWLLFVECAGGYSTAIPSTVPQPSNNRYSTAIPSTVADNRVRPQPSNNRYSLQAPLLDRLLTSRR